MDGWVNANGKKWNRASRVRVARLFRSYVRSPAKPNAPIERQPCIYHPHVLAEFHHIDYRHPFRGVWLCGWAGCSCHRKVERGEIEVPASAIVDYTAVVRARFRPSMRGSKNPMHRSKRQTRGREAPF